MKRNKERVARLLKAELPSEEEMEFARLQVLKRLRLTSTSSEAPNEHCLSLPADVVPTKTLEDPDWTGSVQPWWQIHPIWLTAILAIVALLSIPLARRLVAHRNVYAIVENEDGQQYRVAAGQIVATDVWTRLTVTLPDGSRVEMRPQSQLSLDDVGDGLRIRLDSGGVIVTAVRQRTGHLYVDTKHVAVSVVGTVFLVGVEEAGSRVAVLEGKVQVKQGGLTRTLLPPQQMATNPSMELPSLREQVTWSRYIREYLALLQQDTAPVVTKPVEKPVQIVETREPTKPPQLNSPNTAAARPQFEVASVKRNNSGRQDVILAGGVGRYRATNAPLRLLIQVAYHVKDSQIIGAPAWIDSERFDIEGKAEQDLTNDQKSGPFLQALIEERFQLVVHGETRDLPVYFLTIAKSGTKLKASLCLRREPNKPVPLNLPPMSFCGNMMTDVGRVQAIGTQMPDLANALSGMLNRKVFDRTGLAGEFDVNLRWTPDLGTNSQAAPTDSGPSIFTAVEEQLGLRLESGKAPIDVLVIDHIDHASDN
jgi:uncharacterized protein (TIGR03435 family)